MNEDEDLWHHYPANLVNWIEKELAQLLRASRQDEEMKPKGVLIVPKVAQWLRKEE